MALISEVDRPSLQAQRLGLDKVKKGYVNHKVVLHRDLLLTFTSNQMTRLIQG